LSNPISSGERSVRCPAGQQSIFTFLKGGLAIIKILLIIVLVAAIYCIWAAIDCLIAAAREIEMPDIEDIEIVE